MPAPQLSDYRFALVTIAIWIVVVQLMALWSSSAGARLKPGDRVDEARLQRMRRAAENASSTLASLTAAVLVAMAADASAFVVNLLTPLAAISRMILMVAHVQGIGTPSRGWRNWVVILQVVLTVAIALLALVALL